MGMGSYEKPGIIKSSELRSWNETNTMALLTIRKNYDDMINTRIGNVTFAQYSNVELNMIYEGKMTTKYYALLNMLKSIVFDNQKSLIEEYITNNDYA
jgi:hypothetical protein